MDHADVIMIVAGVVTTVTAVCPVLMQCLTNAGGDGSQDDVDGERPLSPERVPRHQQPKFLLLFKSMIQRPTD